MITDTKRLNLIQEAFSRHAKAFVGVPMVLIDGVTAEQPGIWTLVSEKQLKHHCLFPVFLQHLRETQPTSSLCWPHTDVNTNTHDLCTSTAQRWKYFYFEMQLQEIYDRTTWKKRHFYLWTKTDFKATSAFNIFKEPLQFQFLYSYLAFVIYDI